MKRITKIAVLLLICVSAFALYSCKKKASSGGSSASAKSSADVKYQKKIVIATPEAMNVMDPAGSTGVANLICFWMSHSTLIDIDPLTGDIACDLCESYSQLSDVLWEFKLKKGVKFHNGEELKASDVRFTFERARQSTYINDRTEWIEDVIEVDPYTVQIKLVQPAQDILFYFSYSAFSIVSEKALKDDPKWGTKIGTGPYVITDWEFGNYTKLKRFDDYFGELPHTEEFEFRVMPESSARLVALQAGDVDICVDPPMVDLSNIKGDKSLKLFELNSETLQYLALNINRPQFKDQRVRQAIAYAINKQGVINVAVEGNASVAKTFFSSGWGQATDLPGYDYNPEKSKQLLKEAGVNPASLEFTLYACTETKALMAQVIQENLKNIGITCHVEEIELAALKSLMKQGDFDAALYNWGNDSAGPDNNVRPILRTGSGSNRSKFSDKYIDDLMDAAMIEADKTKRLAMYHEIQEYVLDKAPIIPIYYDINYVAAKAGLQNFACDPSACHRYALCCIPQ